MKKIVKIFGIIIAVVISIALIFSLYINFSDIPSYPVEKIEYTVSSTPERVARGRKLVSMLCAGCHLNRETGKLTGKFMLESPVEFGKIHSPNITGDMEHGIGTWTDAELLYLFRTGIKRDGKYSPPYMAKMPLMADEDINSIIAFLRTDDPMVKADPTPSVPSSPSFLTKLLCRIAWKPFDMPKEKIKVPDTSNTIEYGKYLAVNLECYSCHSADYKTNNYLNPPLSEGYFAGGNQPLDMEGRLKPTPNITPHKSTGIGNWQKEAFVKAVKYGMKDGEPALVYPMIPFTQLTDQEVGAIFDYLQTIPPIENKVERMVY